MESTHDDYKLMKRSFEDAMYQKSGVETHKIYRVIEGDSDQKTKQKSDNMLLFHGTSVNGVRGILKEGFRPSTGGSFGPGVYLTASPSTAYSYSVSKTRLLNKGMRSNSMQSSDSEQPKVLLNILVNEVLESNKLRVGNYQAGRTHQFARYSSGRSVSSGETHEKDSNGRKIKTSRATLQDESDHYVCNEKFVIPRYLIEFFSQASLSC